RIPALNNKPWDYPMKSSPIKKTFLGQLEKVCPMLRGLAIQLQAHHSFRGFYHDEGIAPLRPQ
ncbi:MAG: hypothetical protein QXS68_07470, partial [Candidatus Methanomethylicaceae archaeon]